VTRKVLIVGATSGIAQAVARRYAERGASLFLVARDCAKVEAVAADLRARGAAAVAVFTMDANDTARLPLMQQSAWQALGQVELALVAHGTLPDAERARTDAAYLIHEFRTNAESVIVCLAGLAESFRLQGSGVLAVIGSVAGDRGRASNYAYGAAKSAVHAFASGLRAQLFRHGGCAHRSGRGTAAQCGVYARFLVAGHGNHPAIAGSPLHAPEALTDGPSS
jgi:short-subunit dehydrogenase